MPCLLITIQSFPMMYQQGNNNNKKKTRRLPQDHRCLKTMKLHTFCHCLEIGKNWQDLHLILQCYAKDAPVICELGVACNEKFAKTTFLLFWQKLVSVSYVIVNHNVLRIKHAHTWGKSNFEGRHGRGSISEACHALFLYLPKYWQNCDQIFCNVLCLCYNIDFFCISK